MPPEYNPAASLVKEPKYSLQQINDLFQARRVSELAKSPLFEDIFETVLLNKLTTISNLKSEFPGLKRSSLGSNLSPQQRIELLQEFQPAVESKIATESSGSKPPSPPEQCVRPEEEPELPDWLRRAEARLSR